MADSGVDDDAEFVLRLIGAKSAAGLLRSGLVVESADADRVALDLRPLWDAPTIGVVDVRVNGARTDARLASADGRAWLAVLWVTEDRTLLSTTLFERPAEFEAGAPGSVVVLNGPSSVGKSSLMSAFAEAAETPWACLEEPWFGRLPTRFLAWSETAGPVADGFLAALRAAARVGNHFIVSAAGIPQDDFRDALRDVPTVYVGLDAPLDVLLRRQLTQPDKFGGLAERSIDIHHGWEYDLRIDTASCTPADGARQLATFLAARLRSGVGGTE